MDVKESRVKSNVETEEPEGAKDNRSLEQEKNPQRAAARVQNGISTAEISKLNNSAVENDLRSEVSQKLSISNGVQTVRKERVDAQIGATMMISQTNNDDSATTVTSRLSRISAATIKPTEEKNVILPNGLSSSSEFSCDSLRAGDHKRIISSQAEREKICLVDTEMINNVDCTPTIDKCPPKVSCVSDSNADYSYNRDKAMNNIGAKIGSTSHGTCCYLRPNINGNRDGDEVGEGTSGGGGGGSRISRNGETERRRRDSSSGNEGDLSDVEDYCIYTYKGNDDVATTRNTIKGNAASAAGGYEGDREGQGQGEEDEEEGAAAAIAGQPESGRSSPEMDFLEMDFDPGPSCEQDTGDSDLASINEDIQNLTHDNVDTADPSMLNDLSGGAGNKMMARPRIPVAPIIDEANNTGERNFPNHAEQRDKAIVGASTSRGTTSPDSQQSMPSTSAGLRKWEATSLNRSVGCPLRESYSYHNTSGDLISPGENRDTEAELWADNSSVSVPENSNFNTRKNNLSSTLYHRMMAKKLMLNKQAAFSQSGDSNLESELCSARLDGPSPIEKIMLWSEQEATVKQVTQIGTSACGATSAINALLALDVPFSLEVLVKGVATRLREPGTALPRYLMSRSLAGATHNDLIRGMSLATNGAVLTKFFAFYPERNVSLSHWLHHWISRGAVPIATLNLQNCGSGSSIPDAWHHQMIFGVGQSGIYMTNPLECLPEQLVWHQLVSPSILLVRRSDVLAHWNPSTDLSPLTKLNQHWRKLNVLGQVVNVIREAMGERKQPATSQSATSHIRIPASYLAGITLVMRVDSPAAEELLHAEQLPLV